MKESIIQKIVKGIVTHRFNGWMQRVQSGKVEKSYTDKRGNTKKRFIHMADRGTPDMVGMVPVLITPDMLGKTIGVFVAVETKKDQETIEKWKTREEEINNGDRGVNDTERNQIRHKNMIQESGGVYIITDNPDDVRSYIESPDFPFCHQ